MNTSEKRICSAVDWDFLQKSSTDSTVSKQQTYQMPNDLENLTDVTVTIGSTKYTPREVPSRQYWDNLNASTAVYSDIPEWFYVQNGTMSFYPIPASSTTNAITYNYVQKLRDLVIPDYTTGTIVSVAKGGTAVVGSGTSWTSQMVGMYIRITLTTTANTGDGFWYQVAAVPSSTSITLVTPYQGTSIAVGSAAYTLAQISLLPEEYQDMPVYDALSRYFTSVQPEPSRAQLYSKLFSDLQKQLLWDHGNKTTDPTIQDAGGFLLQNPNNFITL